MAPQQSPTLQLPGLQIRRPNHSSLELEMTGKWQMGSHLPSFDPVTSQIGPGTGLARVTFDCQGLDEWDSSFLTFLIKVHDLCVGSHIDMNDTGLPAGVQRLLKLAFAVPETKGTRTAKKKESLLYRIGVIAVSAGQEAREMVDFVGESFLAFYNLLRGKARFRRVDLIQILYDCGAQALGIVSLISILVGLILAFVGAVQLKLFGAEIYIADLVGIGMTREMGAMMAAIIMAGRTGAAFAAQIGTMQVNEEVDALKTLGISPMEFLVLPRMLALILMMPLLCVYADVMGIFGGVIVGVSMLDLPLVQYLNQTHAALGLNHIFFGIIKSCVFGVLVAMSGCLRGLQCGRSASSVGSAATSAVVTAIVAIIVSDGLFAVISNILGI